MIPPRLPLKGASRAHTRPPWQALFADAELAEDEGEDVLARGLARDFGESPQGLPQGRSDQFRKASGALFGPKQPGGVLDVRERPGHGPPVALARERHTPAGVA